MKILVTGGEGFIGWRVCRELQKRGHTTLVIDSEQANGTISPLGPYDAIAIRDFINNNDIEVVCHLAAMVGGGRFLAEREFSICYHNAQVDIEVMRGFGLSQARRLVYTSSSMVFQNGEEICREEQASSETPTIPPPTNNYGFTKLQGERFAVMTGRTFNKEIVIGRPFNVYGPGEEMRLDKEFGNSHVIPDLFVKIKRCLDDNYPEQQLEIFGDGTQTRSFTHADETARAFALMCIKPEAAGETYNVASNENVSIKALAQMMSRMMGLRPDITHLPAWHGDTVQRKPQPDKIMRELGWTCLIPFEMGLRRNIKWLEENQRY